MHQTFYIDVDEEITSVVDRLKKSKTKENIFVVPKRALILQSVVNLRLLKKEAEKLKKQIMIVSQDEQGRAIAERVGILSQQSLENVEDSEELKIEIKPLIKDEKKKTSLTKAKKKRILENIGSTAFYEKGEVMKISASPDANENEDQGDPIKIKGKKHKSISDIVKSNDSPDPSLKYHPSRVREKKYDEVDDYTEYKKVLDSKKEKELKELFQFDSEDSNSEEERQESVPIKNKSGLVFFGSVSAAVIILVVAFLILPKAKINVHMLSNSQEVDLEIKGNANAIILNQEEKSIPARLIEKDGEKMKTFEATGRSDLSDQKAKGMVTVYNEFGTSAQPLVATTRLLSSDGKLFRLAKGVTVPGMAMVDGKLKPGAIEAEVIADQSGEEYNIDPGQFSIPGFQGSSKYEKFYARSTGSMSGGGSSGNSAIIISQKDIDEAKASVESELMNELKGEIQKELKDEEVFIDKTIEKNVTELSLPEVGVMTNSFNVKFKIKVRVIVFSEEKLKELIAINLNKKDNEKLSVLRFDYGESVADLENRIINIKVHGEGLFDPEIDSDRLKKDLLGKNEKQTVEILKKYSQIKEIEVESWPKFISSRIPRFAKRVDIQIIPSSFED